MQIVSIPFMQDAQESIANLFICRHFPNLISVQFRLCSFQIIDWSEYLLVGNTRTLIFLDNKEFINMHADKHIVKVVSVSSDISSKSFAFSVLLFLLPDNLGRCEYSLSLSHIQHC